MDKNKRIKSNILDPVTWAMTKSNSYMRSYQADAMRNIFDAVVQGKGGRFAVTFPRQSGKNEMQAQLEAAVMAANQHRGGNIIKIIPTEKNQGKVSTERLAGVLRAGLSGDSPFTGQSPSGAGKSWDSPIKGQSLIKGQTPMNVGFRGDSPMKGQSPFKAVKDEIVYGNTRMRCLSASPNAAIVGATANLLLEVDEAQMVAPEKFDRGSRADGGLDERSAGFLRHRLGRPDLAFPGNEAGTERGRQRRKKACLCNDRCRSRKRSPTV